MRPPKVLVPMNNVRLGENQPIVLKSIIDAGYPMGKFTWFKDGRPLIDSNRYRANFDIKTRTAFLYIDAGRASTDTGRYTVHVENIVGKDQTTGEVHVEGTPGIDERPYVEPSKYAKLDGPFRSPGSGPRGPILQPDDSVRDRENLPPWIRLVKELEDQDIDENKTAQLVCGVDAHPSATVNLTECFSSFRTETNVPAFRSIGSKMVNHWSFLNDSSRPTIVKHTSFV